MSGKRSFEWHVGSEPGLVRDTIAEIQGRLDEILPWQTQEERGDLRLVFNELLLNAVIHGNRSDKNKRIHIYLSIDGSKVAAKITDEGEGYDHRRNITQLADDGSQYRETGRGILLVHALTDNVSYDRSGRSISFVKTIGACNG